MRKLLLALLFVCLPAAAQKPVRMVVPYTTGGAPDILARLLADELGRSLGATVIVENRPGQGGSIGAAEVARAAPDGSSLLLTTTATQSINQHLYARLAYDPLKDFAGVALIAYTPVVLAVSNELPARSLKELIGYARANPGKVTFASAGAGTLQHIAGELMKSMSGVDMVHVPYKGTGQIAPDLITGRVSIMFNSVAAFAKMIETGKLRALAVTRATDALPGVPTFSAAGLDGFDVSPWYAVFAPAGTPRETVSRLNADLNRIAAQPAIAERLAKLGLERTARAPQELDAIVASDAEKWGRLIREKNIRAD